jgi:hypothetical protein
MAVKTQFVPETQRQFTITQATQWDCLQIRELSLRLLARENPDPNSGFLLKAHSTTTLKRMAARREIYAAKDGPQLLGFVIIFDLSGEEGSEARTLIAEVDCLEEVVKWVDQIAVDPGHAGQGIMSAIYDRIESDFAGHTLAGAIVEMPVRNLPSLRFHARRDWRRIRSFDRLCYRGLSPFRYGLYARAL